MGTVVNMLSAMAGILCVYFLYRRLCFGNKSSLYTVLTAPAVFFNTYYLVDAVTQDEIRYIPAYGNIAAIEVGSEMWRRSSYQYRSTQMVLGTIFRVIRKIYPLIEENTANILFKISHWFFFFILALVIAYIWGKSVIESEKDTLIYRMTNLGILYCLIGLPVSCLILKVSNYDAGNIYFAILAFSVILAAEKRNNVKLACVGAILATFGCMEKWTSLIYYIIAVSMAVYLKMKSSNEKMRYFKAIMLIPMIMICSAGICILNFLYIRFLSGNITVDIHIGAMLFPIVYMVRVFTGKPELVASDLSYYDNDFFCYILIEMLLIGITAALFFLLDFLNKRIKTKTGSFVSRATAVFGFIFVLSGITGAYLIRRHVYPFVSYPEGIYQPGKLANQVSYFYGAKTAIGHTIINIIFANAVVITNISTIALIIFMIALLLLLRIKSNSLFLPSLFLIAFVLVPLFTLSGMPACARYYGVSILLIMLCSVYYVSSFCNEVFTQNRNHLAISKSLVVCVVVAYSVEMLMNLPVYNCFSPIWLLRSKTFKETVRQGEWDAAEAISWGEELALAGKMIQDHVEEKEIEPDNVTVISNYGIGWYTNPGYHIEYYDNWLKQTDRVCDSNTYFVFAKSMLYRSNVPGYITDVEPLYKVKIKSETTAWIYNGDQLAEWFVTDDGDSE